MSNYTKDAIDFAFENKLSDMQSAIQDAIRSKISDALEIKKVEVAQGMFGVSEAWGDDDEDDDVARADRELARMKAKPIKAANIDTEKDKIKKSKKDKEEEMEESESYRTYRVEFDHGPMTSYGMNRKEGVQKHITIPGDHLHSKKDAAKYLSKKFENPKVIRMMEVDPKSITNESIEDLEELSKETLKGYVNKRQWDMGANEKAQKKMDTGLARAETKLKGDQHKLDKNKNGKVDSHDFKLLRKESEELEEKLSVSDGVQAWIKDFVDSDNPKFEGKSKKERIQMALGAFYAAKKGTNEEIEELEELSKKTLGSYVRKASFDLGDKAYDAGESKVASKVDRSLKKANKRLQGVGKAVDRLTKD